MWSIGVSWPPVNQHYLISIKLSVIHQTHYMLIKEGAEIQ